MTRRPFNWFGWSLVAAIATNVALSLGCAGFNATIDDACIAGKIGPDAAAWLNANPETWKRHGDYLGPVKVDDRILNGTCSALVKEVSGAIADAIEKAAE